MGRFVGKMRALDGERLTPKRKDLIREFVRRTRPGSGAVAEDGRGNKLLWRQDGGLTLIVTGRHGWRPVLQIDAANIQT
ncbi:MAG: hypothetical protein OXG35_12900, partial [Acidobacteria bacterium]|nr:hypothetical protein [Acidobacteriota bacterium]